jgi:hypothetical protein
MPMSIIRAAIGNVIVGTGLRVENVKSSSFLLMPTWITQAETGSVIEVFRK